MARDMTRWDPFREAFALRDAMDHLFENSVVWPRGSLSRDTTNALDALPLDMYETPDELVLQTVVPGVKSEDLNIEFNDGRLVMDANIPAPKIEKATYHYRELGYGRFHREIDLPMPVETDKVDATLTNGLLVLRIPKAEEIKPKKIQIKASNKEQNG